jgi:hypothetical protein
MTPQELNDYKMRWRPGYKVQVDVDSDVWGKNYCRKHVERHQWTFDKHTYPDDSHTFAFEQLEVALVFLKSYNIHNPKFCTGIK